MTIEAKAIELTTGRTIHVTGTWASREAMEHELMAEGFAVTWYFVRRVD